MNPTGKALSILLLLCTLLATRSSLAAVSASIDRSRVALGDSLRLTINADDGEDVGETDLQPLAADFEVLQRSSNNSISISNGRRSHTRQLLVDLAPKRQGMLTIPALRVEGTYTRPLRLAVTAPPDASTGGQTVVFEAELDRDEVYVQGQVILTLRLLQSINLDARSISELELDNAFVTELDQNSFQRTIDGRQWLVSEIRYAIFPEESGELTIPAQQFTGRVRQGRRSFFDLGGGGGQLMRRSSRPLSVTVLPRPASFTAPTWLPARSLTLEEHWSTPPEALTAGESATRTISILGEGLQGAQLPPIEFTPIDGLKYYPDQAQISDREVASGLLGTRRDSAALVPTRAGTWQIPEIRVPWWDTGTGQLRYATLPAREITVAAAEPTVADTPVAAPALPVSAPLPTQDNGNVLLWQGIAALSSTGWLLTLAWLWWGGRHSGSAPSPAAESPSQARAWKALLKACADNAAGEARSALVQWADALAGEQHVTALREVLALLPDTELEEQVKALDSALYSSDPAAWQGAALAQTLQRLRKARRQQGRQKQDALQLYPA